MSERSTPSMEPQVTEEQPPPTPPAEPPRKSKTIPIVIGAGVAAILVGGFFMYRRAASKVNDVSLSTQAKPVTVVAGQAVTFRPTKRYVATIDPWFEAQVGPQLVSAYVDTVIYRPGAVVKKGDVLATLDCKSVSAESASVAMEAKALEAKEVAIAAEAARLHAMLDGGFVPINDVQKKEAEAAQQQADILAQKAKLLGTSLEVNDCVLKSPFDGEISDRYMDPGAFAKPGTPLLSVVDRSTVRIAADIPEIDFALAEPGKPVSIKMLATGQAMSAPITRRTPTADPSTRTVHFEIDVSDPKKEIPVGTTAELTVEYGDAIHAARIPLLAAAIRGDKATVFVVEGDVAKKQNVDVLGESGGDLFVDPSLVGAKFVTEGRGLLNDNDKVKAGEAAPTPSVTKAAPAAPSSAKSEGTL